MLLSLLGFIRQDIFIANSCETCKLQLTIIVIVILQLCFMSNRLIVANHISHIPGLHTGCCYISTNPKPSDI